MASQQWHDKSQKILLAALKLSAEERGAFLDEACRNDDQLRREVESLLAADDAPVLELEQSLANLFGEDKSDLERSIGPYKIDSELGRGGMGTVYLAHRADGRHERAVAIKILDQKLKTPDLLGRFQYEQQVLATINHPGIVTLHDAGTTEQGLPYLVMEYIEGASLTDYCDSHKLATVDRLKLFQRICEAVNVAHQHEVVHRDIKPGNILITKDGQPKLLDFGIAKILTAQAGSDPTETGSRLMTRKYASPEQIQGGAISTRSDVYSLGVVLYVLLTGRAPYDFSSAEAERVICEAIPPKPSLVIDRAQTGESGAASSRGADSISTVRDGNPKALRRSLKGDVDTITLMALRKEPERRYSSALELSDDIDRHLNGMPVRARRSSFVYRSHRFLKRNLAATIALATVILLAVGFLIVLLAERKETRFARVRAESISTFLIEIFELSDPYMENKGDVTARRLLDDGAEKLALELKEEPEIRAAILNTLGRVYMNLELLDDGEALLREAVEIGREVLEETDLQLADSVTNLAGVLHLQGELADVEDLYLEGLRIREENLGRKHPLVAESLNNLGGLYDELDRYQEAEVLFREAIQIKEMTLGPSDQSLAKTLNNLAFSYRKQARFAEAEELHLRSLDIRKRALGERHLSTVLSLNNLAAVYQAQGRYEEAEKLFMQVLELRRELLGDDHPRTAASLNTLASLYSRLGRYGEAQPMLEESLAIKEQALPQSHPSLARTLGNLGLLYKRLEKYEKASECYARALRIIQEAYGNDSAEALGILSNVANLRFSQGRLDEAIGLLEEVRKATERTLGLDHPRVAIALNGLGKMYTDAGRYSRAESAFLRSLEIRELVYGPEHSKVATLLENYAVLLRKVNREAEAAEFENRANAIRDK